LKELGPLSDPVVEPAFVQIAKRGCVPGHDCLVYNIMELYADRLESDGADVRGCVVRRSVVQITDAGGQVADEITG
jgi:hypothetical protein